MRGDAVGAFLVFQTRGRRILVILEKRVVVGVILVDCLRKNWSS